MVGVSLSFQDQIVPEKYNLWNVSTGYRIWAVIGGEDSEK